MAVRDYPRKSGDRTRVVVVKCSQCSTERETYRSRLSQSKNFFCDKQCHRAWQATLTGQMAARWSGGVTNRGPAAKARKARYRERNREELRKKNAAYFAANPDKKSRYRKINWEKWYPKAVAWGSARRARKLGNGGSHTPEEWQAILERFGPHCPACGRTEKLTQDHVIPLTRGGSDAADNLQPLCDSCNKRKGNRLIICYVPWRGHFMHENIYQSSN